MREWGESCLRYPNQIQPYFAKVFGDRGFLWKKNDLESNIQVSTTDTSSAGSNDFQTLGIDNLEAQCLPSWQFHSRLEEDASKSKLDATPYVQRTVANVSGEWALYSQTTVTSGHITATVYRYKSATCNCDSEDEDEDEDFDDENESQGEAEISKTGMLHEPSIWFLSAANNDQSMKWFHHVTKTGLLQKSAPVFVPGTPFLLWPQGSTNILVIDTNTWKSTISKLPARKSNDDLVLISQGMLISLF